METRNAVIESTMLGTEDHGIMTFFLHLNYGGIGQGFGGWSIDEPIRDADGKFIERLGTARGLQFIQKILQTLEVESWEKLKGVHCRVKSDHNKVYMIGHLLKDKWMDPQILGFK